MSVQQDPYFHRLETKQLLRAQAESNDITIFGGAGLGSDQGRPSWPGLLKLLLLEVGRFLHLSSDAVRETFAKHVLGSHDLISIASIVREALGSDFMRLLHQSLYSAGTTTPGGIFAPAVAYAALVWRETGGRCVLVTTNYDD